jgi:hypothetical protein
LVDFFILVATHTKDRCAYGYVMYGHLKSAWPAGGVEVTVGKGELDSEGGGTVKLLDEGTGTLAEVDGKPVIEELLGEDGMTLGGLLLGPPGPPEPTVPLPLTTDEHATTASATIDVAATNRIRTISLQMRRVSGRP